MTNLPGVLGHAAPPTDDDVQRQLRELRQDIAGLVTARTLQASETSGIVPGAYNGSTDNLTFPGGATRMFAHEGSITAPITCSQVLVHAVATAGDTGGGGLYLSIYVCNDIENPGDPGTVSEELASEVVSYASLTGSFVRVMPGMSAGAHVFAGAMVGTPSAGNAGTGNAHLSFLAVFVR